MRRLVLDATDPAAQGRFWSALLDRPITSDNLGVALTDDCDLVFVPSPSPKMGKNRVHLDLAAQSRNDQHTIVEHAGRLGAVPVDIGQGDVPWVVLADPDGNEFCVLEPRAEYRDVGPVAAVVVDALDPPALARFWSQLTGLPVTRTQPEFASIRQQATFWLEFIQTTRHKEGMNRLRIAVAASMDHPPADPEGNEFSLVEM